MVEKAVGKGVVEEGSNCTAPARFYLSPDGSTSGPTHDGGALCRRVSGYWLNFFRPVLFGLVDICRISNHDRDMGWNIPLAAEVLGSVPCSVASVVLFVIGLAKLSEIHIMPMPDLVRSPVSREARPGEGEPWGRFDLLPSSPLRRAGGGRRTSSTVLAQ
jgi:hypothetical protein